MTIIKDITAALRDAKGVVKELDIGSKMRASSIARMSSEATLQFPVIMSRAINVNTAQSVTKALERQYAIMVQIAISLRPYIDLNEDDIPSYLKKNFHQNNVSGFDIMESCMNVYSNEAYGIYMLTSINHGSSGNVVKSNKDQLFSIEECLNPYKINDLYQPEQISMEMAKASLDYFMLTEAKGRVRYRNVKPQVDLAGNNSNIADRVGPDGLIMNPKNVQELNYNLAVTKNIQQKDNQITKNENEKNKQTKTDEQNKTKNELEREKFDETKNQNKLKNDLEKDKFDETKKQNKLKNEIENKKFDETKAQNELKNELENKKLEMELQKAEADYRSRIQVKLADNDVKKANELVPTTLSITLMTTKGDTFGGNQNFVIGVKGLMHPVDSNEMIGNLLDGYRSGNKFFNFIRWTTGEIAFIKDLLLNIDELKDDVIKKHSKGHSKWWTVLKRRKSAANIKNRLGKGKLLPNASIVCSMEEVVELNDVYGLDLMDSNNVKKLMQRYFLLGFAIVDEAQELCYFIFDGENDFQALSFNGLEKENNSTNDFKEIYKMINSGRL